MRSFRVLKCDGCKHSRELYERIFHGNSPSSAASKAATVVFKTRPCLCETKEPITINIQEVTVRTKNGQQVITPLLTKEQKTKERTYTAVWNPDTKKVKIGDKEIEFAGSPVVKAIKDSCS